MTIRANRGRQFASVFCPLYGRIFRELVADGSVEIIPVIRFPRGAPVTDENGRRAYFGVRCSRATMRAAERRRLAELDGIVRGGGER